MTGSANQRWARSSRRRSLPRRTFATLGPDELRGSKCRRQEFSQSGTRTATYGKMPQARSVSLKESDIAFEVATGNTYMLALERLADESREEGQRVAAGGPAAIRSSHARWKINLPITDIGFVHAPTSGMGLRSGSGGSGGKPLHCGSSFDFMGFFGSVDFAGCPE